MRIPSSFRSLNTNSLQNASAMSADKAMIISGNTGWLFEAFKDGIVPGNTTRSNYQSFNHTGNGSGKHLPVIMNKMRGLVRSGNNFDQPVNIVGDGSIFTVPFVMSDTNTGNLSQQEFGYNWRTFYNVPIVPHIYARKIRTQLVAKLTTNNGIAKIWPVIFEDINNSATIMTGREISISASELETLDLELNLDDALLERDSLPGNYWYWGVQLWVPAGSVVDIMDSDSTGPCLAICSI